MKIGEFARKNEVTIDTVRHYMDIGLLIPLKDGAHYVFSNDCVKTMKEVLDFKAMGFSLEEISKIIDYRRFCRMNTPREAYYLKGLYRNRIKRIDDEVEYLLKQKSHVETVIHKIDEKSIVEQPIKGLHLKYLTSMVCGHCRSELTLNAQRIEENQIINGRLSCECGMMYIIRDGIIFAKGEVIMSEGIDDDLSYYEGTDPSYMMIVGRLGKWIKSQVSSQMLKGTVIDLGVGRGHGLSNLLPFMHETKTYIMVDRDEKSLRDSKRIAELSELNIDYICVCCDYMKLPFKLDTVDTLVDIFGSSNGAIMVNDFPLVSNQGYLKQQGWLIGSYGYFLKYSKDCPIPLEYRKHFDKKNHHSYFEAAGIEVTNESSFGYGENGGVGETYLDEADVIHMYGVVGRKTLG